MNDNIKWIKIVRVGLPFIVLMGMALAIGNKRQSNTEYTVEDVIPSVKELKNEEKLNNVSAFLLKELIWEIGSSSPEPIDFFDPLAIDQAKGLSREEIRGFTLESPITEEMLHTRGKYAIKIRCNGLALEGHLNIVDTTPPIITVPKELVYEINDTILYKKDVDITDNSGETLELMIDCSEVKANMAGTYQVYYSAIDSAGNKGEATADIVIKEEHKVTKEEMDYLADELLVELETKDMMPIEQLKVIFDWCYNNIRYVSDADKSSLLKGAYDGIYYRTGDCYTYYAAAAWLMDRCGIENLPVSKEGEKATHYWSLVKIDQGWYHFDCSPHKGGYRCFMQTDKQVQEYVQKNETDSDYYSFDEEGQPQRSEIIVYKWEKDEIKNEN